MRAWGNPSEAGLNHNRFTTMKTLLLVLLAGTLSAGLTSCYGPYYGYGPGYCPPPVRSHHHYDHSYAPRHHYRGYRGCR